MSKRRNRRRKKHGNSEARWPSPPSRTVFRQYPEPHYEQVPTEVHRAFSSLGRDNKTSRLSDGEFYSQVGEEVEYMFDKSTSHLGNAIGALCELGRLLF